MTTLAPGSHDDFGRIDSWDEARAESWARGLDSRAAAADQRRLREEILAIARLQPGHTVVEIGAGTGPLLPALAAAVGAGGRVIAIEPQPVLARFARERLSGLAARTEVRVERGEASTLDDATADVCIAQTVLCHLPPTLRSATLESMLRLTRSGGRVISADQDADTWVIDHPDRGLTRRIVEFYCEQRFADGWTGRRLRGWFSEAGLAEVETRAIVTVETEVDSYMYRIAIQRAETAAQAGWITPGECAGWVEALAARPFFSSLNFYVAAGRKR